MRRFVLLLLSVTALCACSAASAAAGGPRELRAQLARDLRGAGPASGAHVVDLRRGRVLFSARADVPRVMMSNTKLFTTAAVLEALGPRARFETVALGAAPIGPDGVLDGDLVLRGGGDPTFDEAAAVRLVAGLRAAGLTRVRGGVIGDGSLFDAELGPPGWELNDSPPGPVSALQFKRGIVGGSPAGLQFAPDPAAFAADGVRRALLAGGVAVDGAAGAGPSPPGRSAWPPCGRRAWRVSCDSSTSRRTTCSPRPSPGTSACARPGSARAPRACRPRCASAGDSASARGSSPGRTRSRSRARRRGSS